MKGFGNKNNDINKSKDISIENRDIPKLINKALEYHKKNNIEEAKKLYQIIIDRGSKDARVMTNYAIILKDNGQNEKAIKVYKDVIKLYPERYIAYFNLGNLFRDYGNLKQGEYYFKKTIQLSPKLEIAFINLANLLAYKGELEKSNELYLKCINRENLDIDKKIEIKVSILINKIVTGDFQTLEAELSETKQLIAKKSIEHIKDTKIRNNSVSYANFIEKLFPLLKEDSEEEIKTKIPHIGESHCLTFAHQKLILNCKTRTIQPVLIQGGKAWHFSNNKPNKWKNSLTEQVKYHQYSDEIFISFGEIDCRKNEGILSYSKKNNKDHVKVCKKTIKGYVNHMESVLKQLYKQRYYFGIPAPIIDCELTEEIDLKRKELIELYNLVLKEEVIANKCFFVDVYDLTTNNNKENNKSYMCDSVHLSPNCLSLLIDKYIYK